MFAYDIPERDRRRVVAGRRERSSRWRWHCPHRNLHLCHCCMRSTEMADKGLLSTILGMPRSTCAAAQIIPRGVKTIAEYARLSSSFTSSSTPSAHVTLDHWILELEFVNFENQVVFPLPHQALRILGRAYTTYYGFLESIHQHVGR